MTSKVISLNQVRKKRSRAEEKAEADQNAVKFGRTKAQRLLEAAQAEQARQRLDQSQFEDD
ncbi:protein of unknown function [Loktanella sp. DSM 29012]|uniref:DUF4169 family protein n=1 Tax=Loktanella gaetbuli TaxID=2881335 RepID=A0ABS8BQM0_9RHOB|nr:MULTISPECIES: DUF4169 family protein [Loktanella]MCB5198024.1 DUF4169 family protein [Loktanella gaetbuli]SEQ22774.1 protein of unknown function [Loktanella sp. DSM 29012]